MTHEATKWAHTQWSEKGYTQEEIAEALFVNLSTLRRSFKRYGFYTGLRKRNEFRKKLVAPEDILKG